MEGTSGISNNDDHNVGLNYHSNSFDDTGYYYKFLTSNDIKLIKHMLEDNGFR